MGLFKADFYRFFALGFVGGALVVFGTIYGSNHSSLSDGLVPVAEAAASH